MRESHDSVRMPRRAFLAWGSALAGGAFGGRAFAAPPARAADGAEGEVARVAVGYGAPVLSGTANIMDACRLPAGDGEFAARGARVSIYGLGGMALALAAEGVRSFSVGVAFTGTDAGKPLLVHAWHFANGAVPHLSPGNSLVVPVDPELGLNLVLEVEDTAGEKRHALCQFTTGRDPSLPKLLRGMYALAPSESFAWRGLAWSAEDGPRPRIVRCGLADDKPVDAAFPGLAMMIDYSDSRACVSA